LLRHYQFTPVFDSISDRSPYSSPRILISSNTHLLEYHLLEYSSRRHKMSTHVSLPLVQDALNVIAETLKDEEYAVIGGAALISMGMTTRTTDDIDILVRQGTIAAVKNILAQSCLRFVLDKKTRHLEFRSGIDSSERPLHIDVLSPQMAYIPYELVHPIQIAATGLKIASAKTLLNFKISSSYTRSTHSKKITDWRDVAYLVQWHVINQICLPAGSCANLSESAFKDLVTYVGNDVTLDEWKFVGGRFEEVGDDCGESAQQASVEFDPKGHESETSVLSLAQSGTPDS
jgi:hypothetical protein